VHSRRDVFRASYEVPPGHDAGKTPVSRDDGRGLLHCEILPLLMPGSVKGGTFDCQLSARLVRFSPVATDLGDGGERPFVP
jgi:hypothetical protein